MSVATVPPLKVWAKDDPFTSDDANRYELAIANAVSRGEVRTSPELFVSTAGTGQDDTAALVAALTNPGPDKLVTLASKTYLVSPFTIPAGVTLEGHNATLKVFGTGGTRYVTMSSNSVLRGCTVDCDSKITTSGIWCAGIDSFTVEKSTIKNMTAGDLISCSSVTNGLLEDIYIDTCYMGVHVYNASSGVTVKNVRVKNWIQRGIYVAASTSQAPTDIDIIHCLVTDLISQLGTVREPIQVSGNPNARIKRVRILDSKVIGPGRAYTDTVTPGTADQFNTSNIDGLLLRNCISIFGGDCGFSGAGNTNQSHEGCYAEFNDTAGIAVGGSSGGSNGAVLSGNTCVNNHQNKFGDRLVASGPGIYLYASSHITLTGNNVGDTQDTPTQAFGIASHAGCDDITMEANVGSDVTFHQLYVDDGTATNVDAQPVKSATVPTSGVWVRGQRVRNPTPAVGQPKGWLVTASGGAVSKTWSPSTTYSEGDWVSNTSSHILLCLESGTSGSGINAVGGGTWGAIGTTITDGTVTWVYMANASAAFASEGNL